MVTQKIPLLKIPYNFFFPYKNPLTIFPLTTNPNNSKGRKRLLHPRHRTRPKGQQTLHQIRSQPVPRQLPVPIHPRILPKKNLKLLHLPKSHQIRAQLEHLPPRVRQTALPQLRLLSLHLGSRENPNKRFLHSKGRFLLPRRPKRLHAAPNDHQLRVQEPKQHSPHKHWSRILQRIFARS